ncbi:hypothetical protein [Neobacillus sp. OS1-33]|uniref:hypothetical protein n=1 Tax=Neobacillus sp. OS1-33 TaxID=3070683 RepID=UPI0027DF75AB|nr:hypothetical protein [Neobacillus sp. OS1-33]WML27349.1 hypothetical protein RCG22_06940 [Neobacillus sp. OS1-33]
MLLTGFDKSEENQIYSVVYSMITAINKKDAEGYIQTLDDYFIKSTYDDKEFIRKNIDEFGYVDLLEFKVLSINTYTSYANYKLKHTNKNKEQTTFFGKMILVRSEEGWKIYYVSEEELKIEE